MKTIYVKDLLRGSRREGATVELLCWVKARRDMGHLVFLDLCDSTGTIQAIARNEQALNSSVGLLVAQEVAQSAFSTAKMRPSAE